MGIGAGSACDSGSRPSCVSARATAASSAGAVTVSRSSVLRVCLDVVAEVRHETLRLGPGGVDELVALATRPAAFLGGLPQRLRGPQLGGPGTIQRLAGLAFRRADPGKGLLERPFVLREARTGVGDDAGIQPESLRDRERLAAARQADREPVGRGQRFEVELDRGVAGAVGRMGVGLELRVVGRRRDQGSGPDEVVEQRLGERRALGRVGARAELVEQDQRPRARPPPRSG